MNRTATVAIVIGLALAATLLATNDLGAIWAALKGAGWGILIVIALHVPQTVFSALGWRPLIAGQSRFGTLYLLRWVRESVNSLLPVAQIGGDLARARLLGQRGVALKDAVASCMVDLSLETVAQALFTLMGAALLLGGAHDAHALEIGFGMVAGMAAIAIGFVVAQRFGLFKLVERLVGRWSEKHGGQIGDLTGLNDAVVGLYRQSRRLGWSTLFHLGSWIAGILETYAALRILGLHPGWREAAIIESLGQAVRAAGFLIPGALGVQEGGLVLIGGIFGIVPGTALALSLIRRIRELALGLPGLAVWQRMEKASAKDEGSMTSA
ncbi:flippase-like domain-containing protein [Sphingomonas sp. CROZ-RG-20F-R02-07]|uniref:flippase-like domain-containing protein n=1 Tax=Sphingomonas sp. CROZ-RG-20F-R02-07 TaxID=2914832 RepID=UPI001F5A52B7|nr:flippase-like domain-containing protein [Sphingomonas sp. CROZ-RG-20F-R02-07]